MIYTDEYQLEKFTKKFRLNHENSSGIYKDKHAEIEALLSSSPPLKTPSITTHAPQPQDDIEIEMPFDRRSPSPVPQQHIQTRADLLNNANPAGNQQLDPKLPNNSYSKVGKARKKEVSQPCGRRDEHVYKKLTHRGFIFASHRFSPLPNNPSFNHLEDYQTITTATKIPTLQSCQKC